MRDGRKEGGVLSFYKIFHKIFYKTLSFDSGHSISSEALSGTKGIGKEHEKEGQVHSIFSILELARDKVRKIDKYRVAFSRNSLLLGLAILRGI